MVRSLKRIRLQKKIKRSSTKEDFEIDHNNGWRTCCTSAILNYFKVFNFRFSQCAGDVVRILRRNGYFVSRCNSVMKVSEKGKTLSVAKLPKDKMISGYYYLILVPSHVLLMDDRGMVVVDTSPKKVDRRKVYSIWKIKKKI